MVVLNPDSKVKSTVIGRTTVFDQYAGTEKWGLSSAEGLTPGYSNKVKNAFFSLLLASLRDKEPSSKESGSGWKKYEAQPNFF